MGIKNESQCLLMGLDGVTYQTRLVDLSPGGATITMRDDAPHGLHVGEMCGFMLRSNPNVPPDKHTGKIVTLDSGSVVISFSHQEHHHQKKKFTSASWHPSEQ
jgi:hypothetical protein